MNKKIDKRPRYFCDYCYTNVVDEDDNIIKKYYSCYQTQDWRRHVQKKKHIQNKEKIKKLSDDNQYYCGDCGKYFDKNGYKNHRKINDPFSHLICSIDSKHRELSCNNFIVNEYRCSNIDEYMKRAFRHPKKNNYRPKAIRKSTRQHLSESIGENYVNKKIRENEISDNESHRSDTEEDWAAEEPSDWCYDPNCLLPKYEHLNREEKERMKFAGYDFCECEEISDSDSSTQLSPSPVTPQLKVL